jgi:hypothetical protein
VRNGAVVAVSGGVLVTSFNVLRKLQTHHVDMIHVAPDVHDALAAQPIDERLPAVRTLKAIVKLEQRDMAIQLNGLLKPGEALLFFGKPRMSAERIDELVRACATAATE